MIFIMLGTQKHSFNRLLNELEKCDLKEEIVIQKGYTIYENNKYKIFDFVDEQQFQKYVNEADIIITHGGAGSIFSSLNKDKKIIAVPRIKKYKEHINDHQIELCNKLKEKGYLEVYIEGNLNDLINKIKNTEYKKYVKDDEVINKVKTIIDNI